MLVRHTMTKDPVTVDPEERCIDVLRTMRRGGFRHAPVVKEGALVGVVSERDLLKALPHLVESFEGEAGREASEAPVRSVMQHQPRSCGPSDPVDVVARQMLEGRIGSLTVVDDGQLVGILTTTDLLRGFTDHLIADESDALTLLWTRGDQRSCPDVPRLVNDSGLRLKAYFVTETALGAISLLVRVTGTDDERSAFIRACVDAGLLLMSNRSVA